MADQPSIKIVKKDDSLNVYVPLTSQGKFRCKIRDNFQEYGTGFAPKSTLIPSNAYVEWQIGYDRLLNDEKKTTSLGNLKFIGANGKNKNPYELSEIMYMMCELGCFSSSELDRLKRYVLCFSIRDTVDCSL